MYLIAKNCLKCSEEDVFDGGCLPETAMVFPFDLEFKSKDTVRSLIDSMKKYFDVTDDNIVYDACDEEGRIDIEFMECDDGTKATEKEIELWKEGNKKLWSVTYTFYTYSVDEVRISLKVLL